MGAFIGDAMNTPISILFSSDSIENVASIGDLPNFSVSIGISFQCIEKSRIPCSSILVFDASRFLVLVKLSSLFAWVWSSCSTFLEASITFSCLLTWEHPTSKFESKLPRFPEASPALLLSSSFTRLTRDPELCDEISSSHWLCITRLMSLAYAVGEPSFKVVFCPRFDMTPDTVRSVNWEREKVSWNGHKNMSTNSKMLSKQRKVVPFISWETSVGQNVSELVLGVNIFNLDLGFQN